MGGSQFLDLTWEHLKLTFVAMAVACAIAIPAGLWLGHIRRGSFLAISVSNVGRAVPSLALIALFVAYLGTGFTNVTLALVLLAIPPILTNTYVAVTQVEGDTVDAARGMGMTGAEIVRKVELPLALPLIFGGVQDLGGQRDRHRHDRPARRNQHARRPDHQRLRLRGHGSPRRRHVRGGARNLHGASPRRRSARRDARRAEARTRHRVTAHETPFREGSNDMKRNPLAAGLLALLLMLTASFTIAACGEDDDEGSSTGARHRDHR